MGTVGWLVGLSIIPILIGWIVSRRANRNVGIGVAVVLLVGLVVAAPTIERMAQGAAAESRAR